MTKADDFIPVPRVCPICGREFLARRRYGMFDSAACRMLAVSDYKKALKSGDTEWAASLFVWLYPDRVQA